MRHDLSDVAEAQLGSLDALKALSFARLWLHDKATGRQTARARRSSVAFAMDGDEMPQSPASLVAFAPPTTVPSAEALAAQKAETTRRRSLAEENCGYALWLRARDHRAELLDVGESSGVLAAMSNVAKVRAGLQKCSPKPVLDDRLIWYRVSERRSQRMMFEEDIHRDSRGGVCEADADPSKASKDSRQAAMMLRGRLVATSSSQTRLAVPTVVCWRGDFVKEVRMAAHAEGLRRVTITQYSKGTGKLMDCEGYSEVACSSGGFELWSPAFLRLLEALRVRWGLIDHSGTQCVRLTEEEWSRRFKSRGFPEKEPLPDVRPKRVEVPPELRSLCGCGEAAPQPPPLPLRLPIRTYYEQDEKWTLEPWSHLQRASSRNNSKQSSSASEQDSEGSED